jgi:hypothetical protein
MNKKTDLNNIVYGKRNRVMSIEGVLSLVQNNYPLNRKKS